MPPPLLGKEKKSPRSQPCYVQPAPLYINRGFVDHQEGGWSSTWGEVGTSGRPCLFRTAIRCFAPKRHCTSIAEFVVIRGTDWCPCCSWTRGVAVFPGDNAEPDPGVRVRKADPPVAPVHRGRPRQ